MATEEDIKACDYYRRTRVIGCHTWKVTDNSLIIERYWGGITRNIIPLSLVREIYNERWDANDKML